ncbi:uncharacterized protein LACBIDRAFT_313396 [Laccaria bicolor S238N-H82]|uniref:Predicted protein n=1 Tax=Laccaria bicolor (strain S238N-H82 / ATCC MYA-4686) TaxID=486041 RepID=B0DY81_LACBS|nr:uncharacterized protein LACBIDRAFT_313396 [Laccaria bicolor S238N-H82]EDR00476.1 predicted protein [Laccaria bicolor S238N-H82]|eukprot:XP_001888868.1 predicted protein [Laccaria bicolor S238N-H82]
MTGDVEAGLSTAVATLGPSSFSVLIFFLLGPADGLGDAKRRPHSSSVSHSDSASSKRGILRLKVEELSFDVSFSVEFSPSSELISTISRSLPFSLKSLGSKVFASIAVGSASITSVTLLTRGFFTIGNLLELIIVALCSFGTVGISFACT